MHDRKKRNVLDEREMMEMYRVEHFGLWLMYGLLCASILVQLLLGAQLQQMAGELAVVIITSVAMIVANARHGIWEQSSRPSMRGNAAYSVVSGVLAAAVLAAVGRGARFALLAGAGAGAACMLLLTGLMQYMKRRQEKTEEELDNE
ncbi:MAG: DUF6773 family protein [Candidatus Ventricola sp.]